MRRALLAVIAAAGIVACSSESNLPTATGKGSIRAINAIPTSPEISFLIEERVLAGIVYKANSTPQNWDDLEYTFNFEYRPTGATENTRIASQFLEVNVDVEYTFLVWGNLSAPTIAVWEKPEREFSESDTVFELRVANAAQALGPVDVYFALDGVAPVLGQQFATLAPGEISTAADFPEDSYVAIVTPPGDPATILYQSNAVQLASRQSSILTVFEGDANDTAPVAVRLFNQLGAIVSLPDPRFLPTQRFIHGTMNLATSDIYDDAAVMNRVHTGLAFGDATPDIDAAVGDVPITFTAENNPGAILFEQTYTTFAGTRSSVYMHFTNDVLTGTQLFVDRRSIETAARLTWFHAAVNHLLVDLYVLDAGEAIDDADPLHIGLTPGLMAPPLVLAEGSFDLYVTTSGEKTILDGPIRLDTAFGDVVEAILLDRVDPALAEFRFIPLP